MEILNSEVKCHRLYAKLWSAMGGNLLGFDARPSSSTFSYVGKYSWKLKVRS
jgi:hypothetical protein